MVSGSFLCSLTGIRPREELSDIAGKSFALRRDVGEQTFFARLSEFRLGERIRTSGQISPSALR